MAKWLICASREASEEATAIVEAADETEAEDKFREMDGTLQWAPGGESSSMDYDCYSIEQVDDDEAVGVQQDEDATKAAAAPALLAIAKQVLAWGNAMGGWEALCWKALAAAVDKAEGGTGGWVLIDADGSGLQEIQRDDDEGGIFDNDGEALSYVRFLAAIGDYDAADALRQHERDAAELAAYRAEKEVPADA